MIQTRSSRHVGGSPYRRLVAEVDVVGHIVHHDREREQVSMVPGLEAVPPRAKPQIASPIGPHTVASRTYRLHPVLLPQDRHAKAGTKPHVVLPTVRWSRNQKGHEL